MICHGSTSCARRPDGITKRSSALRITGWVHQVITIVLEDRHTGRRPCDPDVAALSVLPETAITYVL
jgi:hypothetical protein